MEFKFVQRLLFALLLTWSAWGDVLNLGVILPTTAAGDGNRVTLDVAVNQINTRQLIPNHTLALHYVDSQGEPKYATLAAMNLLQGSDILGIIGDTYSSTSIAIAPIAEYFHVPMISPSASSQELSDKELYPYFLRTIPSDVDQTSLMVALISAIGWRKVAIIVSDDSYGFQALVGFKQASEQKGLIIMTEQTFDVRATNVSAQLRAVAQSGAKIVVLFAIPNAAATILNEALYRGMLTKDYAWIGSDGVCMLDISQVPPQLAIKMQGLVGTKPFVTGTGVAYIEYMALMQDHGVPSSGYNLPLYDIPFVYANAFQRMVTDGADVHNSTHLLAYLRSAVITGATGTVSFDTNGDRHGPIPFDILNWKSVTSTQWDAVGQWQAGNPVPSGIIYSGNSTTPPPDDPNAGIVKIGVFALVNSDRGSTRYAITKVAIDDFNALNLIPGVTLSLLPYLQTSAAQAILDATSMVAEGVVGVIGPTSSDISTNVGSMLGVLAKPQISFSATSPVLSNKQLYPYFMRTVASDDWQVNVFAEVVKHYKWNRVGFLNTIESYGSDGFQGFLAIANRNGIEVVSATFQTDVTNLDSQMKYLKDSNVRIILTMVNLNYCPFMYKEIFKSELTGSGYVWIHSDTCSQASAAVFGAANTNRMPGMMGIQPFKGEGDVYLNLTSRIATINTTFNGYGTTVERIRADPYAMYNYDAAFAFGYAIEKCKSKHPNGMDFSIGVNLRACLYNTTFTGISGPLQFNAQGDRLVVYSIINYQAAEEGFVPVGKFDPVTGTFSIGTVQWLGGANSPPDLNALNKRNSLNGLALGLAVGLGVAGLVIVGILFYLFSKRKRAILYIEAVPWDDSEFSGDALGTVTDAVDTGLRITKTKLDFGLKDKDRFPVDKKMTDYVEITNETSGPIHFKFYAPLSNHKFVCKIYPGEGTLKRQQSMRVTIEGTLLCTSDLEHLIKVTHNDSKSLSHSQFLQIVFEGDISDKLDPDELQLKEALGKGAFGTVYRGIYRGREVAIKTMNTQSEWIPADVVEFNKELDLLRRLKHLNIVTFVACSLVPAKMCLVTEYCKYGSLSKFIKDYPDMPLGFRLRIALDVAEGVNFLHANGVLHRDIKADNVLLVSRNAESNVVAKITDFGTARTVTAQRNQAFNHTAGMGTPLYMAPEILKRQPYNNKVDVFSYGIFLWELMSGEEPYNFIDTPWDIPRYVMSGKRCPIPPGTPPDIENLIKNCWAQDPTVRPSFEEIIVTLNELFKRYHQAQEGHMMFASPSTSNFSGSFIDEDKSKAVGGVKGKEKEDKDKLGKEKSKDRLSLKDRKKEEKKKKRHTATMSIEMEALEEKDEDEE